MQSTQNIDWIKGLVSKETVGQCCVDGEGKHKILDLSTKLIR